MHQTISDSGLIFIKSFEILRLSSWQNTKGVWTIGYGHTQDVKSGQVITDLTALSLLQADIMEYEECIQQIVTTPLSQNQFDALVSFSFSVGLGVPGVKNGLQYLKSGTPSSLLLHLNNYKYNEAAEQFSYWIYQDNEKQPSDELKQRREKEKQLFLSGHT